MNPSLRMLVITLAMGAGLALAAGEETGAANPQQAPESPSAVADVLRQGGAAGKEAVVLFRRKGPKGEPMARCFEAVREKLQAQAIFLSVEADDPKEAASAKRYQIDRVDGPAVLVLAPDGTLLAGFMEAPEVAGIERVLASRILPDFQRAMAGGGLLLVAVGDPKAGPFQSMLAQARAYADRTRDQETILQVDSTDPAEACLLERLGLEAAEKTVLCILKAGKPVGRIPGKVSAEQIERLVSGCEGVDRCGPDG